MTHYLVELYTPNAAWSALTPQARQAFLSEIGAAMGGLAEMGVKVLTLAPTEPGIDAASEHRYLGIWSFPAPEIRDALLAGIRASGWYRYFDHINAAASTGQFESHLAQLIASE